jgi:uncharacterized protein with ParB-like and HNH nuclease domain
MYIKWLKDGALDFDADYQRDYVWGHEEQQAFLQGLISGFPLGYVALARAPTGRPGMVHILRLLTASSD